MMNTTKRIATIAAAGAFVLGGLSPVIANAQVLGYGYGGYGNYCNLPGLYVLAALNGLSPTLGNLLIINQIYCGNGYGLGGHNGGWYW